MSLKNCPSCYQQVSSNAEICPHCGAKLKYFWGTWKSFAMGIASFTIGGILVELTQRRVVSHDDGLIGGMFAYFGMVSILVSILFAIGRFINRNK